VVVLRVRRVAILAVSLRRIPLPVARHRRRVLVAERLVVVLVAQRVGLRGARLRRVVIAVLPVVLVVVLAGLVVLARAVVLASPVVPSPSACAAPSP
jgi:hypothetical protein